MQERERERERERDKETEKEKENAGNILEGYKAMRYRFFYAIPSYT